MHSDHVNATTWFVTQLCVCLGVNLAAALDISYAAVHELACRRPCSYLCLPGLRLALCEHASMCVCAMGALHTYIVSR